MPLRQQSFSARHFCHFDDTLVKKECRVLHSFLDVLFGNSMVHTCVKHCVQLGHSGFSFTSLLNRKSYPMTESLTKEERIGEYWGGELEGMYIILI